MKDDNKIHKKDPNKVADHTAIPNWSGYIYQGLCAAYVALRLCIEEPEKARKYLLSLDSFEDFAILDEKRIIVALHQCKCFGGNSKTINFTIECEHMRIRKENYVKKGKCDGHAPMYFHSNKKPIIDDDIEQYKYHDGEAELQPDEVEAKITSLIDKFNKDKMTLVAGKILLRRLYYWIDQNVLQIHRETIANPKKKSADIAKEKTLAINDLYNCLKSDGFSDLISRTEVASYVRLYYLRKMQDEIYKKVKLGKTVNYELVDKFISALSRYPADKLWDLFIRLNPHHKSTETQDASNFLGDNPKCLFKVINEVKEGIEEPLYWHQDNNYQSPAAFSCHDNADEICYEIIKNRANLDVLFNFRWLVADSDETVDDLCSRIPNVTKNTDIDNGDEGKKIFNPQNIGILKIDDKNADKY